MALTELARFLSRFACCSRCTPSSGTPPHSISISSRSRSSAQKTAIEPSVLDSRYDSNDETDASTTASTPGVHAADWWEEGQPTAVKGLEGCANMSRLVDVRIVHHAGTMPWKSGESMDMYEAMGARDPDRTYVAVWANMGDVSLLALSEVIDHDRLDSLVAEDFLQTRVAMILNPVKVGPLPCPLKHPRDAETVGAYLGARSVSTSRERTSKWEGTDVLVVQIDLHAKWILKVALKAALRNGNIVDVNLVDYSGQTIMSSCRLNMNETAMELLRR